MMCGAGTLQSADQFLNLKLANARTYRLQIERGSHGELTLESLDIVHGQCSGQRE